MVLRSLISFIVQFTFLISFVAAAQTSGDHLAAEPQGESRLTWWQAGGSPSSSMSQIGSFAREGPIPQAKPPVSAFRDDGSGVPVTGLEGT